MTRTPSDEGFWQATVFLDDEKAAAAGRRAREVLREQSQFGNVMTFLHKLQPRLALSFTMPEPVGRGLTWAPGGTARVDGVKEVTAVYELGPAVGLRALAPRVHVPGGPDRDLRGGLFRTLADLLEAEFFAGNTEDALASLPLYDAGLIAEALDGARTALHDPSFPVLPFVQEYANRHCGGSEETARDWLRRLVARLDGLTARV